jgi:hypothetical protein
MISNIANLKYGDQYICNIYISDQSYVGIFHGKDYAMIILSVAVWFNYEELLKWFLIYFIFIFRLIDGSLSKMYYSSQSQADNTQKFTVCLAL